MSDQSTCLPGQQLSPLCHSPGLSPLSHVRSRFAVAGLCGAVGRSFGRRMGAGGALLCCFGRQFVVRTGYHTLRVKWAGTLWLQAPYVSKHAACGSPALHPGCSAAGQCSALAAEWTPPWRTLTQEACCVSAGLATLCLLVFWLSQLHFQTPAAGLRACGVQRDSMGDTAAPEGTKKRGHVLCPSQGACS